MAQKTRRKQRRFSKHFSEDDDAAYFVDEETGDSVWHMPADGQVVEEVHVDQSGRRYSFNAASGVSKWIDE